jgi:hypothetical protein
MSQKFFLSAGIIGFISTPLFNPILSRADTMGCASRFSPLVVQIDLNRESSKLCVIHGSETRDDLNPEGESAQLFRQNEHEGWNKYTGKSGKRRMEISFEDTDMSQSFGAGFSIYLSLGSSIQPRSCGLDNSFDCEEPILVGPYPMVCRMLLPGESSPVCDHR